MSDLKPIAAELGVSERTLQRAVSQGTLRASRPSPRTLWLPLSERRYLRRSWPLLGALRAALRTEPNVRFALLFGSAAVGTDTAESDVDLLVALDNADLDAVVDLAARLGGAVGRRVDVVRLEDAEASPNVLGQAIRDGRVLIDREGVWPTLVVSKVDRERWRSRIIDHLTDFPRQYAALESAMGSFGTDFDLPVFKAAFETEDDMDAYNRVQAVERGVGRVQNYVAELADAGARLADLPLDASGSDAERAFEALRAADVVSGELCRRLKRAQAARSRIEHSYVRIPAGDVHRAAELVHDAARDFIHPFRGWIERELHAG